MNLFSLAKKTRWPDGVRCLACDHDKCYLIETKGKTGKVARRKGERPDSISGSKNLPIRGPYDFAYGVGPSLGCASNHRSVAEDQS